MAVAEMSSSAYLVERLFYPSKHVLYVAGVVVARENSKLAAEFVYCDGRHVQTPVSP
jgi:hypothetical protein